MRKFAFISLVLMALCDPAQAADASAPAPGTSVEMPFLIAPITVEDRLVAYAYISSHVVGATPSAAIDIRDKLAFIQDAFVRDVNARSVAATDDPDKIDQGSLVARLLADAKRIVGSEKVTNVTITEIKAAPTRPNGQTEPATPK